MAKKPYRSKVKIGVGPDGRPINKWIQGRTRADLQAARDAVIAKYITGSALCHAGIERAESPARGIGTGRAEKRPFRACSCMGTVAEKCESAGGSGRRFCRDQGLYAWRNHPFRPAWLVPCNCGRLFHRLGKRRRKCTEKPLSEGFAPINGGILYFT